LPVIRVSQSTWERLKSHARPLEDSADDVVRLALDALEQGNGLRAAKKSEPRTKGDTRRVREVGPKTPQRAFRLPLLRTLRLLGGRAFVGEIRSRLEEVVASDLLPADYQPVSTGDPRWWNAICWERADLVREGLLERRSQRGVWVLSEAGQRFLFKSEREARTLVEDDAPARKWAKENAKAIRVHNERIEHRGIFGEDLRRW